MTHTISIPFAPVAGSAAGRAIGGKHSVIADRPDGVAGGQGKGFSGGQLLAAALGGCFWNDLNYAAAEAGLTIRIVGLNAEIDLDGTPVRVVQARITAQLDGADEDVLQPLFDAAARSSTIANSIHAAIPVSFRRLPTGDQ